LPTFSCHEPPAVIAEPTTLRLLGGNLEPVELRELVLVY
jgi:hypothetical protein